MGVGLFPIGAWRGASRAVRAAFAATLLAGLLCAQPAQAELRVRVEREPGAESCPGESAMRRMIGEELDGETPDGDVRMHFEALDGDYAVSVELGGRTRTIRGRQCEIVARSSALATAIALTTASFDEAPTTSEVSREAATPRPAELRPLPAPSAPPTGAPLTGAPPTEAPAPLPNANVAATQTSSGALRSPLPSSMLPMIPPRGGTRPLRWSVTMGAAGVVGYAPTSTGELSVGALLDAEMWALGGRVRVTAPTSVELSGSETVSGWMHVATALGCGRVLILPTANVEACGTFSGGFVEGDGSEFDRTTPGSSAVVYLGTEIGAWVRPLDEVGFRLSFGPELALLRGRLLVGSELGYDEVWSTDRVGLRLGLEVGIR